MSDAQLMQALLTMATTTIAKEVGAERLAIIMIGAACQLAIDVEGPAKAATMLREAAEHARQIAHPKPRAVT
ncbi:hypothetical protein M9978_16495 [Sphingomonas sp. MG17]|uniref:Uncharacterized protein n=2 Tax=Sphingomonas tagetis TaxID=2949092 RepID=A0A9X2KN01_9SPHN|nr:hypothetical protein [Sphingomonas tagetis]